MSGGDWLREVHRLEFEERIAFGALRVTARVLVDNWSSTLGVELLKYSLEEADRATAALRAYIHSSSPTQSNSPGGANADSEVLHDLRQGSADG